eukprot:GHVL01043648.1.p1 GENE.GHVL01043648.1~~GHVL01043648.1.p1  ORF type:complete len:243 (+),score=63.26 GHVL01043648.1:481-1209(+)
MARCRYDLLLNPLGPNVKLISYDNGLILLYKMQQTPQERKPSRLAGGFNSQMFNRHSIGGPLAVCDASHKGGVMIPQGSLPQGSHNNSLGGGRKVTQLMLTIRPDNNTDSDKLVGVIPMPVGPSNPHFQHLTNFLAQLLPDAIRKWAEQNPQAVELDKLTTNPSSSSVSGITPPPPNILPLPLQFGFQNSNFGTNLMMDQFTQNNPHGVQSGVSNDSVNPMLLHMAPPGGGIYQILLVCICH